MSRPYAWGGKQQLYQQQQRVANQGSSSAKNTIEHRGREAWRWEQACIPLAVSKWRVLAGPRALWGMSACPFGKPPWGQQHSF